MKITALIENRSGEDRTGQSLAGEHGLSIHIEYCGKQYLLDSGSSDLFLENAAKMGIDLAQTAAAVLSHAHYDHSGGYEGFFRINSGAKVYVRETVEENAYYKIVGPLQKYIGIPQGLLDKYAERFVYVRGICEIADGVKLLPHTTANLSMRGEKAHMYRKQGNRFVPDDFSHEQSLIFETENGPVVLNSCSHAGIDTVVEEVQKVYPNEKIAAVIGGFHLMGPTGARSMAGSVEEVKALAGRLERLGVGHIYTGHCTGEPAYAVLKECLGDRITYFSTGTVLQL